MLEPRRWTWGLTDGQPVPGPDKPFVILVSELILRENHFRPNDYGYYRVYRDPSRQATLYVRTCVAAWVWRFCCWGRERFDGFLGVLLNLGVIHLTTREGFLPTISDIRLGPGNEMNKWQRREKKKRPKMKLHGQQTKRLWQMIVERAKELTKK